MTRWPVAAENFHISIDQPDEKAAERALCLYVSLRIFFEGPHATLSTEVIGVAFIRAHQGVWISPGDLHAAYRVHNFFLRISSHDFFPML